MEEGLTMSRLPVLNNDYSPEISVCKGVNHVFCRLLIFSILVWIIGVATENKAIGGWGFYLTLLSVIMVVSMLVFRVYYEWKGK